MNCIRSSRVLPLANNISQVGLAHWTCLVFESKLSCHLLTFHWNYQWPSSKKFMNSRGKHKQTTSSLIYELYCVQKRWNITRVLTYSRTYVDIKWVTMIYLHIEEIALPLMKVVSKWNHQSLLSHKFSCFAELLSIHKIPLSAFCSIQIRDSKVCLKSQLCQQ
jgi:hypothetical protein